MERRKELQQIQKKLLEEANVLQERVKNLRTQAHRIGKLINDGTGGEQPR